MPVSPGLHVNVTAGLIMSSIVVAPSRRVCHEQRAASNGWISKRVEDRIACHFDDSLMVPEMENFGVEPHMPNKSLGRLEKRGKLRESMIGHGSIGRPSNPNHLFQLAGLVEPQDVRLSIFLLSQVAKMSDGIGLVVADLAIGFDADCPVRFLGHGDMRGQTVVEPARRRRVCGGSLASNLKVDVDAEKPSQRPKAAPSRVAPLECRSAI